MSTEKCFCHIKNSVTGERYAVKDATARKNIEALTASVEENINEVKEYIDEKIVDIPSGGGTGGSVYNHYTTLQVSGNDGDYGRSAVIIIHHVHSFANSLSRNELFEFFGTNDFPATGYHYFDENGEYCPIYKAKFLNSTTIRVSYIQPYGSTGVHDYTVSDVQSTIK